MPISSLGASSFAHRVPGLAACGPGPTLFSVPSYCPGRIAPARPASCSGNGSRPACRTGRFRRQIWDTSRLRELAMPFMARSLSCWCRGLSCSCSLGTRLSCIRDTSPAGSTFEASKKRAPPVGGAPPYRNLRASPALTPSRCSSARHPRAPGTAGRTWRRLPYRRRPLPSRDPTEPSARRGAARYCPGCR